MNNHVDDVEEDDGDTHAEIVDQGVQCSPCECLGGWGTMNVTAANMTYGHNHRFVATRSVLGYV